MSSVLFGVLSLVFIGHPRDFLLSLTLASTGPFVSMALEWLAGLAALILLWQRAASQFYTASRRARKQDSGPSSQASATGRPTANCSRR